MKGYGQFCPVAKAAEIVAERWTPLVLRELMSGSARFNDLHRGVPLMSPSLLSRRLKELEREGIVTRRKQARSFEYVLTDAGRELGPVIVQLGVWGKRWTRAHIAERDLDAGVLMWDLQRKLRRDCLPAKRTVVRFDFSGTKSAKQRWWLVIDAGDVALCLQNPGFDVDLFVRTPLRTLTEIWLGDDTFGRAISRGDLVFEGPRELARAFPGWIALSPIVDVPRMRT